MRVSKPESDEEVFTTMRASRTRVALLEPHLIRMQEHAERLGIEWPEAARVAACESLAATLRDTAIPSGDTCLISLTLSSEGEWSSTTRDLTPPAPGLTAISHAAPRWKDGREGTKHGDWEPYITARRSAAKAGADVALLIHEEAVVDADRATLLLLDEDGTAWYPNPDQGGIRSMTLDSILSALSAQGVPVHAGRITATLFSRAREVLLLGTGTGVTTLSSLDGEPLGTTGEHEFRDLCRDLEQQALSSAWVEVGGAA